MEAHRNTEPEITGKLRNVCQSYINNRKPMRYFTGNKYAPIAEKILDYFNSSFVNVSSGYMALSTACFAYALRDFLSGLNSEQFLQSFKDEFDDSSLSKFENIPEISEEIKKSLKKILEKNP